MGLWNSFDEDALLHDKQGGRFFDAKKVHTLNHRGKYFSVRGPLNVSRSPQERPIIIQAGGSDATIEIPASRTSSLQPRPTWRPPRCSTRRSNQPRVAEVVR